jgi:Arc/MetJ-type ribon-helix-helix transcriptional regulator
MGDGNTLAGADEVRSMSTRVHEKLLEEFDRAVADGDRWDSRSEAIRSLMREVADGGQQPTPDGGRAPPVEDDLAEAWATLRELARGNDEWVPERVALSQIAQSTSIEKGSVRRRLLRPLVERGYAARRTDISGQYAAYKVHE